ncbi:MAG TPA: lyase family protein, partial [Acidimicrobiales bacterium]|nr:lyase family protein [Acidimicrobiales bacterium]
ADEFAAVVKSGRTHLMDATPVTLGQEFGGYAAQVRLGVERLEASGALRTIALSLARIANDLRLMGSGPRAGIAEIRLPDLQPGSSIMPGKVNPVIPEATYQVAAQVVGNDAAVAFGATAGAFELNTAMPMMARNLLESVHLLSTVSRLLADRCVAGQVADAERCRTYAESSSALATALTPHIGYEAAAEVVHQAAAQGKTLREVVLERGLLRPGEVERILDVEAMTRGGVL